MSEVAHNMIIANYGASQGFDTDDGSSWYDIHHNFLYQSDGKKMGEWSSSSPPGRDSVMPHAI